MHEEDDDDELQTIWNHELRQLDKLSMQEPEHEDSKKENRIKWCYPQPDIQADGIFPEIAKDVVNIEEYLSKDNIMKNSFIGSWIKCLPLTNTLRRGKHGYVVL